MCAKPQVAHSFFYFVFLRWETIKSKGETSVLTSGLASEVKSSLSPTLSLSPSLPHSLYNSYFQCPALWNDLKLKRKKLKHWFSEKKRFVLGTVSAVAPKL